MPCAVRRRVGWDRDDCWFAHCCMLNAAERKQFADNGLGIAHCPSANLRLGSGIAKVRLHRPKTAIAPPWFMASPADLSWTPQMS